MGRRRRRTEEDAVKSRAQGSFAGALCSSMLAEACLCCEFQRCVVWSHRVPRPEQLGTSCIARAAAESVAALVSGSATVGSCEYVAALGAGSVLVQNLALD